MSRSHTKEAGYIAVKEYGDKIEGKGSKQCHSSQMDELSGEHVGLRLVVGHSDHLGMIVDREVVGDVSFHPRPCLQCHRFIVKLITTL